MLGKVCDIVSFVAVKMFSAKAEQIRGKAPGRNVVTPQVLAEADYWNRVSPWKFVAGFDSWKEWWLL